mgnify:CR=1 FL=1
MATELDLQTTEEAASVGWFEPLRRQQELAEQQAREARSRQFLPEDEDDDDAILLGKAYDGRLVRRLLMFMAPYKVRLIVAVILMIVTSLLSVAGPWIIGKAIDAGIRTGNTRIFQIWTFAFLIAATAEWIFNRSRIAIMAYVGTRVVADMRSNLFRHLHKLSHTFHINYSVGRLMSRRFGLDPSPNVLANRLGRDPVLLVVLLLNGPPSPRFIDRLLHRIGH